MCGRYYLDTLPETLMEYFSISSTPALTASYNIAPTDLCPIVIQDKSGRHLEHARWGLVPAWSKDLKIGARMINARAETAAEKPAFRQAWQRRHCLVPASGFYEWRRIGARKQPYLIRPAAGELFAFAGLWERWHPASQAPPMLSFTILTTVPNRRIAALHDRMPVIVDRSEHERWLIARPGEPALPMAPCADERVRFHAVGTEVNSPRNNHPGLIEPVEVQPESLTPDGG